MTDETPKPTVVMVTGGSGLVGQGIKDFVTENNNANKKRRRDLDLFVEQGR